MFGGREMAKRRLARLKHVKDMSPVKRSRHYCEKAAKHTLIMLSLVLLLYVAEVALAAEVFDPSAAVKSNKRMNFNSTQVYALSVPDPRVPLPSSNTTPVALVSLANFETGEILDNTNPNYDERRWTFNWGVDMVLRFEKGYAYCTSYIIVPAENAWPRAFRGFLYIVCLFYVFLGVAIISDLFMAGIEQITAEKEKVVIQERNGRTREKVVMYTVWNETVANLTLLALGSSAPEILLSVIETLQNFDKVPGELGPSTIVGSASFNLLCITGICMWSVDRVKKIKEFSVFVFTAGCSIWAYVWVLIVVSISSPDIVEVWEAFFTLLMFPMMVGIAWLFDRSCFRKTDDEAEEDEFTDEENEEMMENGDDVAEGGGGGGGSGGGGGASSSAKRR
eukprot:Rhum_TRINITY_DN16949_c0_g1::Rhum_TRINITY_DN16949_c0_g1_i1::g.164864::m.164864/K05849/SLC8A, NCX; solute carrier family 8 (sodium/calcium exchanger)